MSARRLRVVGEKQLVIGTEENRRGTGAQPDGVPARRRAARQGVQPRDARMLRRRRSVASALTVDQVLVAAGELGLSYTAAERPGLWHLVCPVCAAYRDDQPLTMTCGEPEFGETEGEKRARLDCRGGCDAEEVERQLAAVLDETTAAASSGGRAIVAECFAAIRTERPRWLWEGRIPLGAPTLLVGREKLGKSTLTVKLAAEVSRGTLDGDLHGKPSGVLMLSYEDNAGSTVKPRLLAANADLIRVFQPSAQRDGVRDLVSLPDDLEAVGAIIRDHDCRLVIVDPFSAALSGEVNSHRDQDMRRAIASLAQLVEARNAALVLVAHFNKAQGGDALTRVLGSRGLTAAVRSVLVFGRPPDAEDGSPDRVLAHAACNIAAEAPSLTCRIEPRVIETEAGDIKTSRLAIVGDCDTHADDLLSTRSEDERSDLDVAADWLADELADGDWRPAREVKAAGKAAGIQERTLQRAMKHLGVEHRREGFPAISEWRLTVASDPVVATVAPTPGRDRENASVEPKPNSSHAQSRQGRKNGATGDPAELERIKASFADQGTATAGVPAAYDPRSPFS
jgi:AAA domain